MSTASEESPTNNPLDALDALVAATRRVGERAEPRLAAVSDTPFPRAPRRELRPESRPELKPEVRPEFRSEPVRAAASQGDRLENAMSELVRRQIKPQVLPQPVEFRQEDGRRRTLLAAGIGVAAAVALASVAALLFVSIFPRDRERDAIQSFAAAVPPAPPQARQAGDITNGASQVRGLIPRGGDQSNLNHEQSERLLQQFVQWRQKAAALTDKP